MSRKRGLLQANTTEVGGSRGNGEVHSPIPNNRALKKARKIQRGDCDDDDDDDGEEGAAILGQAQLHGLAEEEVGDGTNGECSDGITSRGGAGESGEEALDDDATNSSSDELRKHAVCNREPREEATHDSVKDQGPARNRPISRTSTSGYLAAKYAKGTANKEVHNGTSGSSSDEDSSENEESEQGLMPTRRAVTKGEETSNESSESRSNEESGEEDESEDTEKKPNDSTAFGRAFRKIMKKKLPSTALTEAMGPMLSAHKQLVTKKLEEAAEGRKVKSESKREKQALREKGHTVPAIYAAAKDKELMKLATRGVVKLFNAVSKAQTVQEAAKVSKDSEAKEVAKRSKSTFLAMLKGGNGAVSQSLNMQRQPLDSKKEGVAEGQPGWSALQETFMLGKSRLKDWDKKPDEAADIKGAESSGDDSESE